MMVEVIALACVAGFVPIACVAVWGALRPRSVEARRMLELARWLLAAVAILCLVLAVLDRIGHRNWVHLFWTTQIPLVGAFFCSGVFLVVFWRDAEDQREITDSKTALLARRPLVFLAIVAVFACAPLVLTALYPEVISTGRNLGEPVRRIRELAAYGFGGARPEALGVSGGLPREVTVPMGLLLIGSWIAIFFGAIAVAARCIRAPNVRRAFLLLAPLAVGMTTFFLGEVGPKGGTILQPGFFWPFDARDSGIWRSDPAVIASFGPVVLAALASVAALVVLERRVGRRASVAEPRALRGERSSAPLSSS
jgi:hypothetical protein